MENVAIISNHAFHNEQKACLTVYKMYKNYYTHFMGAQKTDTEWLWETEKKEQIITTLMSNNKIIAIYIWIHLA